MSTKIPLSERCKEPAAKYRLFMDKENVYTVVQNGKSSEGKNDGGKKKGLSLKAENRAVRPTSSVQSSGVGKPQFQIYFDGNDENVRSRPRVRKDVGRKEIRARRDNEALEKTIVSTTKEAEAKSPDLRVISRRAHSSSNCRHRDSLDKITEMNNKLFHKRSYSESRKIMSQYAQCIPQSSDVRKTRHLTDDVKKRTFSSIQMWKDKMRKPYTGTVPKNFAGIYPNVLNVDNKTHSKIKKEQETPVIESVDSRPEVSQNCTINLNQNIEEPVSKLDSLKPVLRYLSNEIAVFLQEKTHLNTQIDVNMRSFISEVARDDDLTTRAVNNSIVTPLDGSSYISLTPMKVRHEKRSMKQKSSSSKETELDLIYKSYECDYLEDVPDTERKREDNAPRLSSRFLRENVNAEQRRLIVGYIIRLGVHCYYSTYVTYQTVKLFNVAIDRILVKTNDIQLIALACLWIILKREATIDKIPSATVILQLAKDLYINQEKDLLMYEKKILSAVKFNTRFADPFSLFSYYILNVNQDSRCNIISPNDIVRVYFCGSYLIELCMLDESLCDIPAYVIAIAATELSIHFVYSNDINVDQPWCQVWRSKQSLTEWEERVMNSTKQIMMKRALDSDKFGSNVIYKKYMRSRYGRVSNFLFDKLKKVIF